MSTHEEALREALEIAQDAFPICETPSGNIMFGFRGSRLAFVAAPADATAQELAARLMDGYFISNVQAREFAKAVQCDGGLQ